MIVTGMSICGMGEGQDDMQIRWITITYGRISTLGYYCFTYN
jgi:hypothetical protein